ncbi:MAG: DUF362 domain-containing protein [Dehalococcoidia bacterium]
MVARNVRTIRSPIGEVPTDSTGSAIGVVRLDPERSYRGVPALLKRVIEEDSTHDWEAIKAKIDYTYESLSQALQPLDDESGYAQRIRGQLEQGKKLLFKPNMVSALAIDPMTHAEGTGHVACTAWPFLAALMRWFHDHLDISYHQMAVGEAATATAAIAARFNLALGGALSVTPEGIMEGRPGPFYAGWGFYFVRRYLADTHDPSHQDDPMQGYDDSVAGDYVPPGRASDRLPLYDLNRTQAAPPRGRDVEVPNGANFKSITLHKAVVGGDPNDPDDRREYPGCVLVNVPRLKVHNIALFTSAIKNLGIGLYPMEAAADPDPASTSWKYSCPDGPVPGMKFGIPHQVWVPQELDETGSPKRDANGNYLLTRTAGLPGTMADILEALNQEGVLTLSVVDAIETTNLGHMGSPLGVAVPEGYVLAGLDAVAVDLLCARYLFKTVPMAEARRLCAEQSLPSEFMRRVPLPRSDGRNIVTEAGVDSPLWRDRVFAYAERRGLGGQEYYVVGRDVTADAPLASVDGHLGQVQGDSFSELMTSTLYTDISKPLWDLQATVLAYAEANDALTGSAYRRQFLEAFDENADGLIDYEEMGKTGSLSALGIAFGQMVRLMAVEPFGAQRGSFQFRSALLRWGDGAFNGEGQDLFREYADTGACSVALRLALTPTESKDPLFPSMTWGRGKWPSLQFAKRAQIVSMVYGLEAPEGIDLVSLYGYAFDYADKAFNGGQFTGGPGPTADPSAAQKYVQAVEEGAEPLPFVLYVPAGFARCGERDVPNVEETADREKMFRVEFRDGEETW